ncbi:MAG: amphi-Trp domain-containing protein [Burkholderiales bacterium]
MKYQDKYVGSQDEIYAYLKELASKFLKNSLVVESQNVSIPEDKELEYKIKYENDEYEGALAVKISWVNAEQEEEEEEEEEPEEEEEEE